MKDDSQRQKTTILLVSALFLGACTQAEEAEPTACDTACEVAQAMEDCNAIMQANCGYFYRCAESDVLADLESGLGFTDEASCTEAFSDSNCIVDAIAEDFGDARQTTHSEGVQQCLGAIEGLECVDMPSFLDHPDIAEACADIPKGLVPIGEACTESDDCEGTSGFCNDDSVCESRERNDYEIPCSTDDTGSCVSDICVLFASNAEGLEGVCSRNCTYDGDCGVGAKCIEAGLDAKICVSLCLEQSDCDGGFTCVSSTQSNALGFCWVTPN